MPTKQGKGTVAPQVLDELSQQIPRKDNQIKKVAYAQVWREKPVLSELNPQRSTSRNRGLVLQVDNCASGSVATCAAGQISVVNAAGHQGYQVSDFDMVVKTNMADVNSKANMFHVVAQSGDCFAQTGELPNSGADSVCNSSDVQQLVDVTADSNVSGQCLGTENAAQVINTMPEPTSLQQLAYAEADSTISGQRLDTGLITSQVFDVLPRPTSSDQLAPPLDADSTDFHGGQHGDADALDGIPNTNETSDLQPNQHGSGEIDGASSSQCGGADCLSVNSEPLHRQSQLGSILKHVQSEVNEVVPSGHATQTPGHEVSNKYSLVDAGYKSITAPNVEVKSSVSELYLGNEVHAAEVFDNVTQRNVKADSQGEQNSDADPAVKVFNKMSEAYYVTDLTPPVGADTDLPGGPHGGEFHTPTLKRVEAPCFLNKSAPFEISQGKYSGSDLIGCKQKLPSGMQDSGIQQKQGHMELGPSQDKKSPQKQQAYHFHTDLPIDFDPLMINQETEEKKSWSEIVGGVKLLTRRSISPTGRSSEKLIKLRKRVDYIEYEAGKTFAMDLDEYLESNKEQFQVKAKDPPTPSRNRRPRRRRGQGRVEDGSGHGPDRGRNRDRR